jgi:hypothetical protein
VKSLAYRLFRRGRMPATLAELAAGTGVLVADEGISIRVDVRGLRMPGRYTGRGVRLHAGAVVLTGDRAALSIGPYVVIDAAHGSSRATVAVRTEPDGVHFHVDLAEAVPGAKGLVDIVARTNTGTAALPGTRYLALSTVEATALARWC